MSYLGRAEEGLAFVKKAMRLNPYYPDWYDWSLGVPNYLLHRYEDAVAALSKMSSQNPDSRIYLAASYAQLGRESEAGTMVTQILEANPEFSIERWAEKQPYKNQEDRDHYLEGLRKAGLPE